MIELYFDEGCPYCVKVLEFFKREKIEFISKRISLYGSSPLKEELRRLGGKTQVPYLVDPEKNVKMYESDDIIEYVRENYVRHNP